MADPDYRFSTGYALQPKKVESFIKPSLVQRAGERGISLVRIDTDKPLISQGPFDCIIHKLYGEDWKRQLDDYKSKYPKVIIIDSPDAIERLHNRISMLQVVSELKLPHNSESSPVSLGIPKQIVIYDAETLTDPHSWDGLKFPLIVKPLVANGSATSHKMSLIFTAKGLTHLKPPIVLQEFVNHGGVIFKVYVAGEYIKCVKRKSLPDVTEDKLDSFGGESIMSFSQVSNLASADDEDYKMMRLDDCEMPPEEFVNGVARGLRRDLKLNLFNFDVIRDSSMVNRYLVIDINYFPGYAKIPCYESVLTDFFMDVITRKEENNGGSTVSDKKTV